MEKFVPLAMTNAPPAPAAEFSRTATSFMIEKLTLNPSKIAQPRMPSRLPTAFLTKDVFEMLMLVLESD